MKDYDIKHNYLFQTEKVKNQNFTPNNNVSCTLSLSNILNIRSQSKLNNYILKYINNSIKIKVDIQSDNIIIQKYIKYINKKTKYYFLSKGIELI